MATLAELHEAVEAAKSAGAKDIILLKCTSSYPASPEDSNIRTIPHLRDAFNVQVGLSDHTMGVGVSVASVALGAIFIEKHFTLSRADGGVDSAFSLEPHELQSLVIETERAWQGLGRIRYCPSSQEKESKQFRRTIRARRNLKLGEKITREDLAIVRPGGGLPPIFIDLIVGKHVTCHINAGDAISLENLLS